MFSELVADTLGPTRPEVWHRFWAERGRSYHVWAWAPTADPSVLLAAPTLQILDYSDTPQCLSNITGEIEPHPFLPGALPDNRGEGMSVHAYIYASSDPRGVSCYFSIANRPRPTPPPAPYEVRVLALETTLYSPWYYVDVESGYDSYVQIGNTTKSIVWVQVIAYTRAGGEAGNPFFWMAIPSQGTALVRVGADLGVTLEWGSVRILSEGPPGAVTANLTVLSPVTGLSFDAPFSPRMLWSSVGA